MRTHRIAYTNFGLGEASYSRRVGTRALPGMAARIATQPSRRYRAA